MYKKIILSTLTLFFMSGCVTREVILQPAPQSNVEREELITDTQEQHHYPIISHTFSGERLYASQRVSDLVHEIEKLNNNSAYVEVESNQNVKVGDFLNITVTPNQSGYLKIIIIDPNGNRSQVLPNFKHNGYLRANEKFYTNNDNFVLKATNPKGLHFVLVVFTTQKVNFSVQQGIGNGYNGFENDKDFINILQSINNQNYGKSYIRIFPIRIY